ncbi:hypothetical protein HU200_002477 [Digitaria exilis]|uniref:Tify domain-containing protein n=1 Tax=Digitaria exilis TaxID=1010633 RepID=A0A835FWS4_9POAL|nr:hypothetical protein HU200_002477 [Digitaria exilis]
MERDFLAAIGNEQQHPHQEKPGGREESGTLPGLLSPAAALGFLIRARTEPCAVSCRAGWVGDRSGKAPQVRLQCIARSSRQHALTGARVIPVSSPFNQNNPMFRVQSSPRSSPTASPAVVPFKQPAFHHEQRGIGEAKDGAVDNLYAGSVNVFDNVSAEKAQELNVLSQQSISSKLRPCGV